MITNEESGTRIDEIASGIHRISTPVRPEQIPGDALRQTLRETSR